jgi:TetR/AcrR family transcriptional regulator, transcriptional repressor for nem operon
METPDTRTRLILAAMHLFWEKGYGSTSIADVLHRTRLNSGSLYHFFPGKQDLLLAVLDQYLGGIRTMLLDPAWEGVDDPIEKIFAVLARYRQSLLDTHYTYGCPIGSLALELHEPDPPVRDRLARNFQAWLDSIHQCLTEAGTRLPATLDRRALARFVLTTMEGGVMQARTFRDVAYFDDGVSQLRHFFGSLAREASMPSPSRKPKRKR